MSEEWDGRAPAQAWWWLQYENVEPFPAFYKADGQRWFAVALPGERAEDIARKGYTLIGRCESPGEAELRGWKACQEAAVKACRAVGRPVGAGDGDTYIPGSSADAERAIRSLTPPKDEPA